MRSCALRIVQGLGHVATIVLLSQTGVAQTHRAPKAISASHSTKVIAASFPTIGTVPTLPQQSAQSSQSCGLFFLPPFNTNLVWRAAYRGPQAGSYHNCTRWSGFGPVRPSGKWHRGIDLAAPTGTPVRAAVTGTLTYGRDPGGWGLFARVTFRPKAKRAGICDPSEPLELIYAHLLDNRPGLPMNRPVPVRAGAIVGLVGCTGNARGMCTPSPESHLHVTLRQAENKHTSFDPLSITGWWVSTPASAAFNPSLQLCPSGTRANAIARRGGDKPERLALDDWDPEG